MKKQNLLPDETLQPYTQGLKEYFPSREAILAEAKALTQKNQAARKRKLKSVAMGSFLSIMAASAWWLDPVLHSQQMTTSIGQQLAYQMADGSTIQLNTNSVIQAESRLRSRQVVLLQGEALFNVSHSWRTFTVVANNTDIRDIGTVFNVRNIHDGTIVTVTDGAVEMKTANGNKKILTKNQALQSSGDQLGVVTMVDASATTAWQQGKLVFDGTPLSTAISEIQRYRQASIMIADEKAAKLRISGAYDLLGIEALIDTLPVSVAVNISRKADGTVVIHSR